MKNRPKKKPLSTRLKTELGNKKYGRFGYFDEFFRYSYWLLAMMLNVFTLFELRRPFGANTPWYVWLIIAALFALATYLEYLLFRRIWPKENEAKKDAAEG